MHMVRGAKDGVLWGEVSYMHIVMGAKGGGLPEYVYYAPRLPADACA